ncbi:MAG: hypothetical protein AAGD01_15365 [Acidobacteriota bacterium]
MTQPLTPASRDGFRRTVFYSLMAGMTPLIPIPWVDDQVLGWVRARMVRTQGRSAGYEIGDRAQAALLGQERIDAVGGCFGWMLSLPFRVVFYLLKKIFKKLVLIFTLKDCVDVFSTTFHEGYLLTRAMERRVVAPEELAPRAEIYAARHLRWAVAATCEQVDTSPVRRLVKGVFGGSRRVLLRGARLLVVLRNRLRRLPQEPDAGGDGARVGGVGAGGAAVRAGTEEAIAAAEAEEEGLTGGLVDRLTKALSEEGEYLKHLDEVFLERWSLESGGGRPGDGRDSGAMS